MVYSRIKPGNDHASDFTEFTTHPQLIHHQVITSATADTRVTTDLFAKYLSEATSQPLGFKLSNFAYADAKLRVRIVVQGQPFAAGLIAASFIPEVHDNYYSDVGLNSLTTFDHTNYLVRPHLILDPSKSETYEIDLDCPTQVGFFGLKDATFGSYIMDLLPITPLISGTAVAPSMSICVYVSLVSPKLQAMTLYSGALEKEHKDGGVISRAINAASHLSGSIGELFPSLSPYTTPFSVVSSGVASVLSLFGFAKPSDTSVRAVVLNRFVDNYSHFDGLSSAPVLASTAANSLGISSAISGSDPNEMLLRNIAAKKGYIRTVTIPTTAAFGDVLHSMNVTPNLAVATGTFTTCTPIRGVSYPFDYWSGDITLTFEVVASVFHRATLLIAYDPLPSVTVPDLDQALQTLQNTTIAVSGNTSVEITVPWSQIQPWLRNTRTAVSTYQTGIATNSNGAIHIFLINPVTSNGSTDGIAMNIYIHSNNMTWATPSGANVTSLVFDSKALLSGELVAPTPISFGDKTDLSLHTVRSFGENYHTVKDVTSKMSKVFAKDYAISNVDTAPYLMSQCPNIPLIVTGVVNTTLSQSLLSFYASAFLGYRGSIRHMFYIDQNSRGEDGVFDYKYMIRHAPRFPPTATNTVTNVNIQDTIMDNYAFTMSRRDICPNAECTAPMLYPYDFVPLRRELTQASDLVAAYVNIETNASTLTIACNWGVSSGDDATFVRFLGWSPLK